MRKPIQNLVLLQGWHACRMTFEEKSLVVECDGLVRGKFPVEPLPQQVIGFRSGNNVAIVDNVEVWDSDGSSFNGRISGITGPDGCSTFPPLLAFSR